MYFGKTSIGPILDELSERFLHEKKKLDPGKNNHYFLSPSLRGNAYWYKRITADLPVSASTGTSLWKRISFPVLILATALLISLIVYLKDHGSSLFDW
jgi:hypothetical protein